VPAHGHDLLHVRIDDEVLRSKKVVISGMHARVVAPEVGWYIYKRRHV
jgi:hypothetical protein